jgi:hypothetical protein
VKSDPSIAIASVGKVGPRAAASSCAVLTDSALFAVSTQDSRPGLSSAALRAGLDSESGNVLLRLVYFFRHQIRRVALHCIRDLCGVLGQKSDARGIALPLWSSAFGVGCFAI